MIYDYVLWQRTHLHGKFPPAQAELSSANMELLRGSVRCGNVKHFGQKENQYKADKSQPGTWQQAAGYTHTYTNLYIYCKKYTFFGN